MNRISCLIFFLLSAAAIDCDDAVLAADWVQAGGPNGNFSVASSTEAPTQWSVTRDQNIRWTKTLPESGQSTVIVSNGRLFFTINKPVDKDSQLGGDIVAYCCDAKTGDTIWTRDIAGPYPLRLSGCFADSSAPPAVTDGQHVCFFNAAGTIACFDVDGKPKWSKSSMPVGRTQPFLINDSVAFIRQNYMPVDGKFGHNHKNAPLDQWTQLQAISLKTGDVTWTSRCGFNMGCLPVPWKLSDGRTVILAGRGGGHSPPETPEGVSLIDGSNGETLWTLPLKGFMSTMSLNIHNDHALIIHGNEHLWVNIKTGKIDRRISIVKDISVRQNTPDASSGADGWTTRIENIPAKGKRQIIQGSNILVGKHHYFRSYTKPWIGRIDVESGKLEHLQLPVQTMVSKTDPSQTEMLWTNKSAAPKTRNYKVGTGITYQTLAENDMRNSRGFVVMGDARSKGNGWGHHASQSPTAIGSHLYVPTMNGTVYVLNLNADTLDEKTIVAINDLGPAGITWTRASLSFANGHLYAHTLRQLISIGD